MLFTAQCQRKVDELPEPVYYTTLYSSAVRFCFSIEKKNLSLLQRADVKSQLNFETKFRFLMAQKTEMPYSTQ